MNPPEQSLVVTKEQAAIRQIEFAIKALRRGAFDIAITLSGAAEGMFSDNKSGSLFDHMINNYADSAKLTTKEWITRLNEDRDWLKHASNKNSPYSFTLDRASYMIARAISQVEYKDETALIGEFKDWYLARIRAAKKK